jgi:hypothetical protein
MEVILPSETLVHIQTTGRYMPGDGNNSSLIACNEDRYTLQSYFCLMCTLLSVSELISTWVELYKKYGDTFRLWGVGFMYVFVSDPDDIEVSRVQ